jgi:AAHS family 4-hydroxybenzoate transporter-like MFS transporter
MFNAASPGPADGRITFSIQAHARDRRSPALTGLTADQRRLFWICFAVAAVDGFDTLVVSFIAADFAGEWRLDAGRVGRIFAAGLLGAMVGGIGAGRLADRFGRRPVLVASVVLFAILTLGCALAPGPDALLWLRFAAGLGLGGAIPTITALTAEHMPAERRASLVSRMFLGFPLGAVGGGIICSVLVPALGWRAAFWLGGVLAVALLPLVMRGVAESRAPAGGPSRGFVASLAAPLAQGRAPAAFLLWLAAFMILLVSYFLINWTPTILSLSGMDAGDAIWGGVLLNLGGVAGALALSLVIDRLGPYRTVGLALALGALFAVLLGRSLGTMALLVPLVIMTGMGVIGGQLNLPAMAAALFPADVRAAGVGWTMGIGRAGSIVGPLAGGWLIDAELGWDVLFLLVAVPTVLAAIALWLASSIAPKLAAGMIAPDHRGG